MIDQSPVGSGDDELERRIASLESEEWLGTLKELKPIQGVDLYAVGFEAGRQAALVSHQAMISANMRWFHARTALISALASVAATVLLMFALEGGTIHQVVAPEMREVAKQTDQSVNKLERAPTLSAETPSAEIDTQPNVQEPDPSINDVLAELPSRWRDRMQGMEVQVANSEDSSRVVDVEPRRLRLAFQRRQLIEKLGETIQ